tara:strand:+ start:116 stop:364 length:249 start_codon:yes stop_codon:yes gene_type:complete
MTEATKKASITKDKELEISTKYSISYIRLSTKKKKTKAEPSGIERQEEKYQRWLHEHPEYKNLYGVEFIDLGVSGRGKNSEK